MDSRPGSGENARESPATPPAGAPRGVRRAWYWPPNWPIRWKLTAVSAGLTFIILVSFGAVVGQLATQQLRDNFSDETVAKAKERVTQLEQAGITVTPAQAGPGDRLDDVLSSAGGLVELITSGRLLYSIRGAPKLGPEDDLPRLAMRGEYQVATAPIYRQVRPVLPFLTPREPAQPVGWIRYGRPVKRLNASITRVRVSILAGIFGATMLAAIGAVVLSRRAMRPVSALTAAAREITRTGDPEISLAPPVSDDEVAELTRTFSEMLRELSLARAEEERLLRRQREFVADASHELRTPLTSVLANLELLEDSLRDAGREDDVAAASSAVRSSRRMRRLVADLQVLARADLIGSANFSPCRLDRIAADAIAELEPLLGERVVEFEADEAVPVLGARDELHRVVVNLIGNAIRHVPGGKQIRVTVTADSGTGLACLTVGDDGPGIPEESRAGIFGRFVRGSGPLDRSRGDGTGLGLAIVKAIAERHQGSVAVGECPLGGAEFSLALPLATGRSGALENR